MQLDVRERLTILTLLPQEGNFMTLKIVRDLKGELGFSEEEYKLLEFKQTGNSVAWENSKDPLKDVEIGEIAREIIAEPLKKMDEDGKLRDEHFLLYMKFVEAYADKKED